MVNDLLCGRHTLWKMPPGQEMPHPMQKESLWQFPPGWWTEQNWSWQIDKIQTDLATNMLNKKNEGNHKASDASHSCDETQEAKKVDSPSCPQVDTDPIPRAERPARRKWDFRQRSFQTLEKCSPQDSSHWHSDNGEHECLESPKTIRDPEKGIVLHIMWLIANWPTSQRNRSQRACRTCRERCRWCASTRCCRGRWTPPPGWSRPRCGRPTSPQARTAQLILQLKLWKVGCVVDQQVLL